MESATPRVLHVIGAMNRGGAESMVMSLYRGLDRQRIQFDFLEFTEGRSDFSAEIERLGGRVLKMRWSQNPTRIKQTFRELVSVISQNGPYLAVHAHLLFGSGLVLKAAREAGVANRVAHSHNTSDRGDSIVHGLYRYGARLALRSSSTAEVACSTDAGVYLFGPRFAQRGGAVIPNSVDLERFHPGKMEAANAMRLLSVARFEPVKNHKFLIDIARELRSRGVEFKMQLVGRGSTQDELEREVADRNLGRQVVFSGLRDDVEEVMRQSDVLLMPSLWEGLPVTLVEAQATGLPCIVSTAVTDEVDLGLGLLKFLPIDDVRPWADAIEARLPDQPSAEKIRMAMEARGYTVESSLAQLLPLYAGRSGGVVS